MPGRSLRAYPARRAVVVTVDVVLFALRGRELVVLVAADVERRHGRGQGRPGLPADSLAPDERLDDAATRIAGAALGIAPSFLDQVGASGGSRPQPDGSQVVVLYVGLVPDPAASKTELSWLAVSQLDGVSARERQEVDAAVADLRRRIQQQPLAFHLLPPTFTLSELQTVYEILMGRRLHKASFRRSLHASSLVEPTDAWRSEGRGRPAQLFRHAAAARRRSRRRGDFPRS